MAAWTGWLYYLKQFPKSFLRSSLFLLGLGLTFNLGRDIGLLVLFPALFGYLVVKLFELMQSRPAQGS